MSTKKLIIIGVTAICAASAALYVTLHNPSSPTPTTTSSSNPTNNTKQQNNTAKPATFNAKLYSTTDATSLWVIANKKHPLNPVKYVPTDLVTPNVPLRVLGNETMQVRRETATALEQMFADAKLNNLNLMISSGYRSYGYQVNLYNGYVQSQGQAIADQQSARPGYSEHQTGLSADIEPASRNCEVEQCFGTTPEGTWLAANAYKYGFIIRYPADKVAVTGYEYEPWHLRYVGVSLATEMHAKGIETLEEFFGISGGTSY